MTDIATRTPAEETYQAKMWLRVLVVLTTLVMLAVNGVAGSVGLFGRTTV